MAAPHGADGRKLCTAEHGSAGAKNYGYDLKISGEYSLPTLRITNDETLMLHQDWCAECTKRGVFLASHHNLFVSMAHDEDIIKKTLEVADEAFQVVKKKYGDQF